MQRVSAESECRERERVSAENRPMDLGTHGRLRARCGSNAQQSCVPATAQGIGNLIFSDLVTTRISPDTSVSDVLVMSDELMTN